MQNIRQYIEQFHLLFLDQLGRKIDKRLCALKGGCNLRFYFKSIRYSEDIDLDIHTMRKDTLLKNVQNILESKTLSNILRVRDIAISNITTPKQTDTTQRWKIAIDVAKWGGIHTKIEFSRRGSTSISGAVFENIDPYIIQLYHLPPILLSHYNKTIAIIQKIDALANRNITQARDVFDLYHLFASGADLSCLSTPKQEQIDHALQNIAALSYQDFSGQVVAFLAEEYQQQYATQEVWQNIVASVVNTLLGVNKKCN